MINSFLRFLETEMLKQEALAKRMESTPYRLLFSCTIHIMYNFEILRVAGKYKKSSNKRSSKICYLSDRDSRLSAALSQRIEDATGLQVKNGGGSSKNSENLQVLLLMMFSFLCF